MTTRRRFLRDSGAALGCVAVLPLTFPHHLRHLPLACNSWPFRGYFDTPIMHRYRDPRLPLLDLLDFPAFLVKHFGIHGVELIPAHFSSTTPAYVKKLKRALASSGSQAVNLMGVDIEGGLFNPHLDRQKANSTALQWIDIAAQLNIPSATFPLGGPPEMRDAPVEERTKIVYANLKSIVTYAESRNVRVLFHNDDIHWESAPQIVSLIRKLKYNVGSCPDFGNYAPRGADVALDTLRQLLPYVHNICHAKDGIAVNGKFYPDDFAASVKATRKAHFKGWYSLEFEGLGDAISGVARLQSKLQRV